MQKTSLRLWRDTVVFSLVLFLLLSVYTAIEHRNYTLLVADKALSHTAFVLIGLSLVLSSVCYFWNFADEKLVFRKYLGVVGYLVLVLHVSILLLQHPFPAYYLTQGRLLPFLFISIPAISIYTLMALISNHYAVALLGGKRWRMILRLGFLAYTLSILYYTINSYAEWMQWFQKGGFLIPSSLLTVYFGIVVLLLRASLLIAQRLGEQKKPQ